MRENMGMNDHSTGYLRIYSKREGANAMVYDFGTVVDFQESFSKATSTVPIVTLPTDCTFAIESSASLRYTFKFVRKCPIDYDDGYYQNDQGELVPTPSTKWSNAEWVRRVSSLADRWQARQDGYDLEYRPEWDSIYEGTSAYGVESKYYSVHIPGYSEHVFISSLSFEYPPAQPEVVMGSLSVIVGESKNNTGIAVNTLAPKYSGMTDGYFINMAPKGTGIVYTYAGGAVKLSSSQGRTHSYACIGMTPAVPGMEITSDGSVIGVPKVTGQISTTWRATPISDGNSFEFTVTITVVPESLGGVRLGVEEGDPEIDKDYLFCIGSGTVDLKGRAASSTDWVHVRTENSLGQYKKTEDLGVWCSGVPSGSGLSLSESNSRVTGHLLTPGVYSMTWYESLKEIYRTQCRVQVNIVPMSPMESDPDMPRANQDYIIALSGRPYYLPDAIYLDVEPIDLDTVTVTVECDFGDEENIPTIYLVGTLPDSEGGNMWIPLRQDEIVSQQIPLEYDAENNVLSFTPRPEDTAGYSFRINRYTSNSTIDAPYSIKLVRKYEDAYGKWDRKYFIGMKDYDVDLDRGYVTLSTISPDTEVTSGQLPEYTEHLSLVFPRVIIYLSSILFSQIESRGMGVPTQQQIDEAFQTAGSISGGAEYEDWDRLKFGQAIVKNYTLTGGFVEPFERLKITLSTKQMGEQIPEIKEYLDKPGWLKTYLIAAGELAIHQAGHSTRLKITSINLSSKNEMSITAHDLSKTITDKTLGDLGYSNPKNQIITIIGQLGYRDSDIVQNIGLFEEDTAIECNWKEEASQWDVLQICAAVYNARVFFANDKVYIIDYTQLDKSEDTFVCPSATDDSQIYELFPHSGTSKSPFYGNITGSAEFDTDDGNVVINDISYIYDSGEGQTEVKLYDRLDATDSDENKIKTSIIASQSWYGVRSTQIDLSKYASQWNEAFVKKLAIFYFKYYAEPQTSVCFTIKERMYMDRSMHWIPAFPNACASTGFSSSVDNLEVSAKSTLTGEITPQLISLARFTRNFPEYTTEYEFGTQKDLDLANALRR